MDPELFHDKFILVKRKYINGNKYKFTLLSVRRYFSNSFPCQY